MKATVRFLSKDHGCFEYGDGLEYEEGELWFEDMKLVDYDGITYLPKEIIGLLQAYGYDTSQVDMYE